MPASGYHPPELRVQILTLHGVGIRTEEISAMVDVPVRSIQDIVKKAKDRGYNPKESLRVKKEHYEDATRPGRPKKKSTPDSENSVPQSTTTDEDKRK